LIEIQKYDKSLRQTWDKFVEESKNGIFSLKRDFVEYHSDRFTDFSLLIYSDTFLIAVLPANKVENKLYSHQGLTWGGLVVSHKITTKVTLSIFEELKNYLSKFGVNELFYKAIPPIFPLLYAQEDLYALHRNNAIVCKREVSSVVDMSKPLAWRTKSLFLRAKEKVRVVESTNFELFMQTVEAILSEKYQTKPTHTVVELNYLKSKFPNNIYLLLLYNGEEYLGGTIYYVFKNVIHTQYIGLAEQGKKDRALSVAIDFIIEKYRRTHQYLSFGISTEKDGNYLNEKLINSKEELGGNAIVHDTYKLCW
jgi:hypothetical protein